MNLQRRDFLLVVTLAGVAATSALWQSAAVASGRTDSGTQSATSIPDFSGIWAHPSLGFGPQLAGPGPVRNKSRLPSGAGNFDQLVGDYTNPILKPEAAEVVKKRGEISLSGRAFPDPDNQCLQNPVTYIFRNFDIQLLQQAEKITNIYQHDDDFQAGTDEPAASGKLIPSVHGDSVGHYEGDTLVVDTVGVKVGRYTAWPTVSALRIRRLCTWLSATGCLTMKPPRTRKTGPKKSGRASGTISIAATGARDCSSNLPWRSKGYSRCLGQRL